MSSLKKECPTCQQEVNPTVIQNLKNLSVQKSQKAENDVSSLEVEIDRIKSLNSVITSKQKKQKDFEDLYGRVDQTLSSDLLDGNQLERSIEELRAKLNETSKKLKETIDENSRRQKHNTRIQVIEEQTTEFERELEGIEKELSCLLYTSPSPRD